MDRELDLRRLRAFLVVAEELNVGRAAERLNITQPALSRQIHALEALVGAELLLRRPRGVALTEAGRELCAEGERLLAHSARALDRTRRAGQGHLGHLAVGFIGSALDVVVRLLGELRSRHPEIDFTLSERAYRQQTAGITTGEDDAAFVRDVVNDDAWQLVELCREESCLVVPVSHALSDRDRISDRELQTLLNEPFVSTRRWLAQRGFEPRTLSEVASTRATLRLVEEGVGLSLMPAGYRSQAGPGVRFVPVEGQGSTLQLALPRRSPSAVARRFMALVAQEFGVARPF